MRPDHGSKSVGVSEMGNNRDEKLRFLSITQEDRDRMPGVWQLMEGDLDPVLDEFYQHLSQYDHLKAMIGNGDKIEGLKAAQTRHWGRIFDGKFGDEYFDATKTIGDAHQRIGLAPEWYLSAYCFVLIRIMENLSRKPDETAAGLTEKVSMVAKGLFLDMQEVIGCYYEAVTQAAADQQHKNADMFEENVMGIVNALSDSAGKLSDNAADMTKIATEAEAQTTSAASATEEAATNFGIVSESAGALASAIAEIGNQAELADQATTDAVNRTDQARAAVRQLADTSSQIGSVVGLIKEIADQTNLLALNATIEAARAGDAGRGFAVVASEVKSLASQTKKATDDIAHEISAIQGSVTETVNSIGEIGSVIEQVDKISSAISEAVDQQAVATTEINRATDEAATGTNEISRTMGIVGSVASDANTKASEVSQASSFVGEQTVEMREAIQKFLAYLRAA